MAQIYPLARCLEIAHGVLFDSSALIDLFQHESQAGSPPPLLITVAPDRRYVSDVAVFEFTCDLGRQQARQRRLWLDDRRFRKLPLGGAASRSFQALIAEPRPCRRLADLLMAATAIAGTYAVATRDRDFVEFERIVCVAEFGGR